MLMRSRKLLAILFLMVLMPSQLHADVTDAQIENSLKKGISFLQAAAKTDEPRAKYLLAYTLAKTGTPPNHPVIVSAVKELRAELAKSPVSLREHYYNAGLAAMLFDSLGGEQYQAQLKSLADYIMQGQRPNGGWYYPQESPGQPVGDTSITQYALLGLWAAEKNGVEIPKSVWSRAATWLVTTQHSSGAFNYHPADTTVNFKIGRPSLAVAGTSSLYLCKRQLYPNGFEAELRRIREEKAAEASVKLYGGLLELIDVTQADDVPSAEELQAEQEAPVIAGSKIQAGINAGMRYLDGLPDMGLKDPMWRLYYIYGVERLGAFAEIDKIGRSDWYQTGSEFLINTQSKSNGSWVGNEEQTISTCFSVLFLYRATARAIKPLPPKKPGVGSGLLAGGRGLPTDLKTVHQKNGKIVSDKIDTPVTDLLTLLESNAAADLKPIQEAVIESVRSDQRDELIGQVDRLENLLKSPDAQVRAIAVWSLARSDDLSKAPLLIERIRKDPDYDVAREANRGLCVLSRRLTGVGYNADPIAALKDEKDTKKIEQRIVQWRASASQAWQDWYLKVRAYRERDDLLDLEKK